MSNKIIVSALVAAALASGIPAFAQDHGYRNDQQNGWQQQHGDAHGNDRGGGSQGNDRGGASHGNDRGGGSHGNDHGGGSHGNDHGGGHGGSGRSADFNAGYDGAGPNHDLRRGERLPSRYHTRHLVVDNWRAHRLSAPPRGYHWVQAGADYVLVAGSSGIISQIIVGR